MTNEERIALNAPASGRLRPGAFETIVYGGLAIGILDFLDASIFFPLYFGITFQRVWWGPASGLLGREAALAGGWNTAILGIFLHFVVAFCIATTYYLFARYIAFLLRHPVISGVVFGVVANYVMQYVVIPLSAIGARPGSQPLGAMLNSIVGHAFLVGLPVALIAAWSARKNRAS
ncbi:MAG TPA: hypothetical protein VL325_02030 [Pyrinomonadaceae bacterium]|nr:hypothetical protein [Pyrinomonadaceae bacterium]